MTPLDKNRGRRPTLSNVLPFLKPGKTDLLEPSDDDAARLARLEKVRDTTASPDAALSAIKIRLERELGHFP